MKTAERVSTYQPLQKRVMINFTKKACGWGGEVKFQKYSEWNNNNYFKIVYRRWFEMKTLEKYASGMAPHKFLFSLDSLHSLACFWTCEDGLWQLYPKYWIASFVFQYLNSQRDNGSSTMLTRPTRSHLSKGLPKNEKDAFKSKYLRISPIIEMAAHQNVYFFDSHA